MKVKKNLLQNYFTTLLVLLPLIGQYGLFTKSLTLGDLFMCFPIIVAFLYAIQRRVVFSDGIYLTFVIWYLCSALIFSPLIVGSITSQVMLSMLQNLYYFTIIILLVPRFVVIEKAYNLYSTVSIVLSIIIFVQFFLHMVTGSVTPWVLNSSLFPLVYTTEDYFSGGYLGLIASSAYRPSSLFSEPAMYAQYVIPCFILNIFRRNKGRKEYIVIIFVSISIFIAKSANGIVYLLVAWIFFGFYTAYRKFKERSFSAKRKVICVACIALAMLPVVIYVLSRKIDPNAAFALSKRLNEIFDDKGESSGSMRVVRGWKIFLGLNPIEKILGIGTGNIITYLNEHPNIVKMFTKSWNGYMSGLSSIFVNMGIIGASIYLLWWLKYFRKEKAVIKGLQVYLMLYLLASSSFNTPVFILTTALVVSHAWNKDNKDFE